MEQVRDYVLTRIPLLQQRVDGLDRKQVRRAPPDRDHSNLADISNSHRGPERPTEMTSVPSFLSPP